MKELAEAGYNRNNLIIEELKKKLNVLNEDSKVDLCNFLEKFNTTDFDPCCRTKRKIK